MTRLPALFSLALVTGSLLMATYADTPSENPLSASEYIEVQTGIDPDVAVIWLHGLGADGHDFEPIVPELGIPAGQPVRFIFPHAPVRPITVNGGMAMRGWYDIKSMEIDREADREGVEQSAAVVAELVEQEIRRGIPARNVFLAGFSQGGAIVLHAGLQLDHKLAGLIVLSSYLPLADTLPAERDGANADTPIFMAHGQFDPVVPLSLGQSSRARLEAAGYTVEWHEYPMPHSVHPDEIADIAAFLARNRPE